MTASRIEPQKVSALATVDIQAIWNGVEISEANGGVFSAPIYMAGPYMLATWLFRFSALTNSGVSGVLDLSIPSLIGVFADQYPGVFAHRVGSDPATSASRYTGYWVNATGKLSTTMPATALRQITFRGQFAPYLLNY